MHFLIPLIRLPAANAGRMDLCTDTKGEIGLDSSLLCCILFKSTSFYSLLLNDSLAMNGSCCLFWETAENEPNHVCADRCLAQIGNFSLMRV